jgi:hypothetical protein
MITVAGGAGTATAPAGAEVVAQPVDGLVQVRWQFETDVMLMDGTYTTSSQLDQGTIQVGISANFGGSVAVVLVRSDGMRMTGPGIYSDLPNVVVNLSGTSDVQSASLTLTQLSKTTDPDSPHPGYATGTATFGVQGWLTPADSGSLSTTTTSSTSTTFASTTTSSVPADPTTTVAPLHTTEESTSASPVTVASTANGQQSLPRTGAPTAPVGFFALILILAGGATACSRRRSHKP